MTMFRRSTAPFLLLLLLAVGPKPSVGATYCATDSASDVLRCLHDAYATCDLAAYDSLLAPDFAYYWGKNANPVGREEYLQLARAMFDPDSTKGVALTFSKEFRVVPGDAADTWFIENIGAVIAVDDARRGKVIHLEAKGDGIIMKVRRVASPQVHFQIYSWWSPDPSKK